MSYARVQEPERMTDVEEDFYAEADYSAPHEAFADHIVMSGRLSEASHILDLGCGPGDMLIRLRRKTSANLWGVDLSPRMLEYACAAFGKRHNENISGVNWVLSDIKRTALPTSFFDVVISNSVLHHIENTEAFWKEISRIAKPGARIHIRDLRRPDRAEEIEMIIEDNIAHESEVVKDHYRSSLRSAYSPDEVVEQLRHAGIRGLSVVALEDRYLDISGRLQ